MIQNLDEAKRAFETACSGDSLARAVGVLVRGGTSRAEAESWAADMAKSYGLPIQPDEFSRIVRRGLALVAPASDEIEEEPEAPIDIAVRPPDLSRFAVPVVTGLSPEQLLAVASDPAGTKQRLHELQKAMPAITAASETLAVARAEFDRRVETAQSDLDQR